MASLASRMQALALEEPTVSTLDGPAASTSNRSTEHAYALQRDIELAVFETQELRHSLAPIPQETLDGLRARSDEAHALLRKYVSVPVDRTRKDVDAVYNGLASCVNLCDALLQVLHEPPSNELQTQIKAANDALDSLEITVSQAQGIEKLTHLRSAAGGANTWRPSSSRATLVLTMRSQVHSSLAHADDAVRRVLSDAAHHFRINPLASGRVRLAVEQIKSRWSLLSTDGSSLKSRLTELAESDPHEAPQTCEDNASLHGQSSFYRQNTSLHGQNSFYRQSNSLHNGSLSRKNSSLHNESLYDTPHARQNSHPNRGRLHRPTSSFSSSLSPDSVLPRASRILDKTLSLDSPHYTEQESPRHKSLSVLQSPSKKRELTRSNTELPRSNTELTRSNIDRSRRSDIIYTRPMRDTPEDVPARPSPRHSRSFRHSDLGLGVPNRRSLADSSYAGSQTSEQLSRPSTSRRNTSISSSTVSPTLHSTSMISRPQTSMSSRTRKSFSRRSVAGMSTGGTSVRSRVSGLVPTIPFASQLNPEDLPEGWLGPFAPMPEFGTPLAVNLGRIINSYHGAMFAAAVDSKNQDSARYRFSVRSEANPAKVALCKLVSSTRTHGQFHILVRVGGGWQALHQFCDALLAAAQ